MLRKYGIKGHRKSPMTVASNQGFKKGGRSGSSSLPVLAGRAGITPRNLSGRLRHVCSS